MNKWKLPPKEKIYEAFSVLADKRYQMESKGKATVTSSDGSKHYTLNWVEENSPAGSIIKIMSDDNASFWQGYAGYPIIAILMINNTLHFEQNITGHFKGIQWKKLNKANKNDYSKVVDKILEGIRNDDEVKKIKSEVEQVYDQISKLNLVKLEKDDRKV